MTLKSVIIGVLVSAILSLGLYFLYGIYIQKANYNKLADDISVINLAIKQTVSEDGKYKNYSQCYLKLTNSSTFTVNPKEIIPSSKWLGLNSDLNDCSYSVNILGLGNDKIRIVSYPSSDERSINIKLIWADLNEDGVPDLTQDLNKDKRTYLEDFLRRKFQNAI